MKKIQYNEEWIETQPQIDEDDGLLFLPDDLELDEFDDIQLQYLNDYLEDFRLKTIQKFVNFCLQDKDKDKSSYFQQIVSRLVIVKRLIDPTLQEIPWYKIPPKFGLSQHIFFDEKDKVLQELIGNNKRLLRIMQMRKKSRDAAKKYDDMMRTEL